MIQLVLVGWVNFDLHVAEQWEKVNALVSSWPCYSQIELASIEKKDLWSPPIKVIASSVLGCHCGIVEKTVGAGSSDLLLVVLFMSLS